MRASCLLLLLAALCASAAARGLRSASAVNWWQRSPDTGCSVSNYVCVDRLHFCLGGYVMRCAAGTYCKTQPYWNREAASPCITDWPQAAEAPAADDAQAPALAVAQGICEEGWMWHDEDEACVRLAEPCGDGFWWSEDEGCCRKVAATATELTCEEGWKWHEEDEACVRLAEPCGDGFWWSEDEGCCRKVAATTVDHEDEETEQEHVHAHDTEHEDDETEQEHVHAHETEHEHTCEEGWMWHEEDEACVRLAEPCSDGFWWSVDEGCCRKVAVTATEHSCEEGWMWHEEDEACVRLAEPCGDGFWWSVDEGCCRKVAVTAPEHTCEEGWKWHEEDEACVRLAEPCGDGFWWSVDEGCCRKVAVMTVTEVEDGDECAGYGCDAKEPTGGWKHPECEGKEACHKPTGDACVVPNWHCVDGLRFCLGDKIMACAPGTVCRTAPYLLHGISPCVWP